MIIDSHTHVGRGLKRRSLHDGLTAAAFVSLIDEAGVQVARTFAPRPHV